MNGLRRHLVRVGDGSPELLLALARRAVAGTAKERFQRAIVLVIGWLIFWRLLDVWPWLIGVLLGAWCWKAWKAADAEESQEELETARAMAEQALAEVRAVRATAGEWRAAMALELADTVHRLADGAQGVHLARVYADWADRGLISPGRTLSDLRRLCDHVGIPVRGSLKVAGAVRIGIHLNDLPDHSPTDAEDDPVGE